MSHHTSVRLGRRDVLAMLGAGTLAARTAFSATDPAFRFSGLDHVTLGVADVKKSVAFYARVFGSTILKDNKSASHHVKLGPNYITLAPRGKDVKSASYLGLGIQNFQTADAKRSLDQLGIPYREAAGNGLMIHDPDGLPLQLWAENSWTQLAGTASPVSATVSGEPFIRPTQINHLLLAVSDPEKSAVFYEKILGSPMSRAAEPQRIWFRGGRDRVGLSPISGLTNQDSAEHLASGLNLGLDHVGLVATFDRTTLTKQLQEAGAKVLPQVASGPDAAALDFRDLDGFRLQITPPPKPRA